MTNDDRIEIVRDYHDRTKHRPDRYARSAGHMDWPNQPDPFRSFEGAAQVELPHPELRDQPPFDSLYSTVQAVADLNAESVGHLFYHSLALSAWKQAEMTPPWSLRINPSSGALHPTEGYVISGPISGLSESPGVYHYQPHYHRLECRAGLSPTQWSRLADGFPNETVFIGLSTIYWRESWKYGERAFRYCNHDVGHAIGCLTYAARLLGWEIRLLPEIPDAFLTQLLGTHVQSGMDAEHAECLLAVFPSTADNLPALSRDDWKGRLPDLHINGSPNLLSKMHQEWPVIDDVSEATRDNGSESIPATTMRATPSLLPDRGVSAEQIIRQRRSARDMDGETSADREVFYQMLQRLTPGSVAVASIPYKCRVSLAIFVHRVTGLEPGLYLLIRDPAHAASLRKQLKADFEWELAEGCPDGLQLFRLVTGDVRRAAKIVSCNQDIASDGAFAMAMLAQFDSALETAGAAAYPQLFWETGVIGQVLYLEAEAAGLRGTGIGCFFDDLMHDILGITDHSWQSLYHFTVGGAIEDEHLQTLTPYHHLQ